jgi:hypothetical protein
MILCLFHQIELSMNSCSCLLIFENTQIGSTLAEGCIGRRRFIVPDRSGARDLQKLRFKAASKKTGTRVLAGRGRSFLDLANYQSTVVMFRTSWCTRLPRLSQARRLAATLLRRRAGASPGLPPTSP